MQSDEGNDNVPELLEKRYAAPPLDARFSATLVERLGSEAAPSAKPRISPRLSWTVAVAVATVAVVMIAVVWVARLKPTATPHEVAKSETAAPTSSADTYTSFSLSDGERKTTLERRRSLQERESLRENLLVEQTIPTPEKVPKTPPLSVLERRLASPLARGTALGVFLYSIERGRLVEINPVDGSRRAVGDLDWKEPVVLGAAGQALYIVSNKQLYEVNPTTGARRTLGNPHWSDMQDIVAIGDKLYIFAEGHLYRVDSKSGSYDMLPGP